MVAFQKEGAVMLPLIIFGVTVGAILGTRFRVLVLVPVIFFAAVTIIAAGFVNGFGVGVSLVVLLVFLASVEFGYLAGCFGAGYFFGGSICAALRGCLPTESPLPYSRPLSSCLRYFMNSAAAATPNKWWRLPTLCHRPWIDYSRNHREQLPLSAGHKIPVQ
jgi:hypothetical protein